MRFFSAILFFLFPAALFAQPTYLGIYFQNEKIGYSYSEEFKDEIAGKPMNRFVSKTVIDASLLGQDLTMEIDMVSWTTTDGKPTLMKFVMNSGGRFQKVEANYSGSGVHLAIDQSGQLSRKTLTYPKDAPVVEDALTALLEKSPPVGKTASYYVLDPTTLSFVKNTATVKGPAKTMVNGKEVSGTLVELAEPRSTMKVYLTSKGDLIKVIAIGSMEMIPVSKEVAIAKLPAGKRVDIAEVSKISVTPPIDNMYGYSSISYRFTGGDWSRVPSDTTQKRTVSGDSCELIVTPRTLDLPMAPLSQLATKQPQWLKPGLHIPANDPQVVALSKKVTAGAKDSKQVVLKIAGYVNQLMNPNAGIGVLRDAREILKSKEGVCRDYAILTATLMRAAKVPTKLVSGLVYDSGGFYYHAWVEVWSGTEWLGVDTTRSQLKTSAGHIKLGQGNVEEAFLFTFLEQTSAKVIQKKAK